MQGRTIPYDAEPARNAFGVPYRQVLVRERLLYSQLICALREALAAWSAADKAPAARREQKLDLARRLTEKALL